MSGNFAALALCSWPGNEQVCSPIADEAKRGNKVGSSGAWRRTGAELGRMGGSQLQRSSDRDVAV